MTETTVDLDEQLLSKIQELAKKQRRSPDLLVREAITVYLDENEPRPLPSGTGKYRSGRGDVSERIEELLGHRARPGT